MLFINSLSHFFVDAACAAALFGSGAADMTTILLIYNTLAFSTQCIVGLITDRLTHHSRLTAAACIIVALGFILPLGAVTAAVAVALGNSLFHVCGGTVTLNNSNGRAAPLGVFVAPGSMGLILGTLWPQVGILYAIGLIVCAGTIIIVDRGEVCAAPAKTEETGSIFTVTVLLLAVAVRAIGGTAVSFSWKTTEILSVVAVGAVFAGKFAGGFVCDSIGARKTALISVPLAALLVAFGSGSMLLSITGQILINITMPVTLWLIYKELPDSPGFAFGLAASVLWPGTIAGQLMTLTGSALWLCVVLSFCFGLAAILFAVKRGGKKNAANS